VAVLPEADRLCDRPPVYEVLRRAAGLCYAAVVVPADPTASVPGRRAWRTLADFVDEHKSAPAEIARMVPSRFPRHADVAMEMFAGLPAGIQNLAFNIPLRGRRACVNAILTGKPVACRSPRHQAR